MTDEIVNLNFDDFLCMNLKLVSGEEIIAHIDPDDLQDKDNPVVVLHDPFLVTLSGGLIVMSLWLLANSNDEQVICKTDIMVSNKADPKYEDLYSRLVEKKHTMENDDSEDVMEDVEDKIISSGTETIN